MINDDFKKLKECVELFEGIGRLHEGFGLSHLQVIGLELEPSNVKIASDKQYLTKEKKDINPHLPTCPPKFRPVLKVD